MTSAVNIKQENEKRESKATLRTKCATNCQVTYT